MPGAREPTLATLRGIVAGACRRNIPFENVDVLLGRGVRLDVARLVDKLVHRGRGGYCFEHNSLLQSVLQTLGFEVEGWAAGCCGAGRQTTRRARTHMLLRVMLPEGDFLADVGFGGLTLTAPLRLAIGPEQETPHEPHRLVAVGGRDRAARPTRRPLGPALPLLAAAAAGDRLRDGELVHLDLPEHAVHREPDVRPPGARSPLCAAQPQFHGPPRDGRVERRTLADAAELHEVLTRDFRVEIPASGRRRRMGTDQQHGIAPLPGRGRDRSRRGLGG